MKKQQIFGSSVAVIQIMPIPIESAKATKEVRCSKSKIARWIRNHQTIAVIVGIILYAIIFVGFGILVYSMADWALSLPVVERSQSTGIVRAYDGNGKEIPFEKVKNKKYMEVTVP